MISLVSLVSSHVALSTENQRLWCPKDLETLITLLLRDLPSYANRVTQRARRRSRSVEVYSYVILAGRPEFEPLTLGPGAYTPTAPDSNSEQLRQVFITTLERQYVGNKPVLLQQYHWLFLTHTDSGWLLAMMFSQTGLYSDERPPTAPRESSQGVIGQAIQIWLRDCRAGVIRPGNW
ncbi:MAG TPA: hypothetical protein DDW76_16415 [Cyanobacteria bacterium UBA11369]|nr:hypothetical protein [Cyanobacteria bacterium UBA11371]HBE30323.1 hypothetical protein [Cyanobacteria bacterium UBA11368]HBE50328.1 hypothetical protein [Cyanobacteria bacterium UBA11369]